MAWFIFDKMIFTLFGQPQGSPLHGKNYMEALALALALQENLIT